MKQGSAARMGFRLVLMLLVSLFAACGGGSNSATIVVTSVTVTPGNATVVKGLTQQFTATANYSDGTTAEVTGEASWESDVPSYASVNQAGLATGVNAGTTNISATFDGVTGQAILTVTPAQPKELQVTPTAPSVPDGQTVQFTATAVLTDNSTQNVTSTATWTSGTSTVASISAAGLATAQSKGTTVIRAVLGSLQSETTLTVTDAVVTQLQLSPSAPSIPKGTTRQMIATAVYSDGTSKAVTDEATWNSSDTNVATVGGTGLVSGAVPGTTTISASFSGQSANTVATVTDAAVASVAITPSESSIPEGGFIRVFSAIAAYTDGTFADVTQQATWTSSDTDVATVSNDPAFNRKGQATSGSAGDAEITASFAGVSSAPADLTVTTEQLTSIAIEPAAKTIGLGQRQQFGAIGTFGSGAGARREDVTYRVTWASSDLTVATISNASDSIGLAVSQSVGGPIDISATYVHGSDPSKNRTAKTTLTVSTAVLESIQIFPVSAQLPRNFTRPFQATGLFSDGSVADITGVVTWVTSDSSIATISNVVGSRGVAFGASPGTATIRAIANGLEQSAILEVTSATLSRIDVTPASETIPLQTQLAYTATGVFSDGFELDITRQVTWDTSDENVATIDNVAATYGIATGQAQGGPIDVTATRPTVGGNVVGTAQLSVSPSMVVELIVRRAIVSDCFAPTEPAGPEGGLVTDTDAVVAINYRVGFIACAEFSDGQIRDVTRQAVWTSQDETVATVGNTGTRRGVATGLIEDRTAIVATFGGTFDSNPLQVTTSTLTGITVAPPNATMDGETTIQYTAVGTFSDGTMIPLTTQVTWSASPNTNPLADPVTISNADGSQGRASPSGLVVLPAFVTITATRGGVEGTAPLTRTP